MVQIKCIFSILGKKKEQYVANIMTRVATAHTARAKVEAFMKSLQSSWNPDPAPVHTLYRASFNIIDLLDGYWYEVDDKHGNHVWKSKMLFAIMRFFMINVWVLSVQEEFTYWKDFRANIASDMVVFDVNL